MLSLTVPLSGDPRGGIWRHLLQQVKLAGTGRKMLPFASAAAQRVAAFFGECAWQPLYGATGLPEMLGYRRWRAPEAFQAA